MHEPELLILDEPIAGLDPLVQQSFHALLREVAAQGRTVFLSSHTLSEVERVADRVAILRRGRLVVVDSLGACARSPSSAGDRVRGRRSARRGARRGARASARSPSRARISSSRSRARPTRSSRRSPRTRCARSEAGTTTSRRSSCATTASGRRMSVPAFRMAMRLRLLTTALSALGMALVIVMVGALFPSVGDSIGKLDLPEGVTTLLGGADYGTITGWMRSEIGAVYGPLAGRVHGHLRRRILDGGRGGGRHPRADARLPDRALAPACWQGRRGRDQRRAGRLRHVPRAVVGVAVGGGGIALANIARAGAAPRVLRLDGRRPRARARRVDRAPDARRRGGRGVRRPRVPPQRLRAAGRRARVAEVPLALLLLRGSRPDRKRRRRRPISPCSPRPRSRSRRSRVVGMRQRDLRK